MRVKGQNLESNQFIGEVLQPMNKRQLINKVFTDSVDIVIDVDILARNKTFMLITWITRAHRKKGHNQA